MEERFSAYAGMGAAFLAVALIGIFFFSPATPEPIGPVEVATLETVSTPGTFREQLDSLIPDEFTASSTTFEELLIEPITRTSTKAPAQKSTPTTGTATTSPTPTSTLPTTTPSKPVEPVVETPKEPEVTPSEEEVPAGIQVQNASVNILCSSKDKSVPAVSGSGVIISPEGVILTVAHIAQVFLLEDYPSEDNVTCVIRTGSPARTAYTAKLIYISKNWVTLHPDSLILSEAKGTGEYDIALLAITGSLTSTPLPSSFDYVPLSTKEPKRDDSVIIGAYGGQTLSATEIKENLKEIMVGTTVKKIFTFGDHTYDLLSFGGNEAAQSGSSGGGVVNLSGELVAMITTSTIKGDFASRNVSGITPNYIRRVFKEETGKNLDTYLKSTSPKALASAFITDALALTEVVVTAIEKD